MPIDVLVTFDLEPALVRRIEAVTTDARVRVLGNGARERFLAQHGRSPFPSELQAATPLEEIEAALVDADVAFAFWGGALATLGDVPVRAPRLRWVQLTHAGAEHVDPAFIEAGITFTSAAGLASTPIAEMVLAYILMYAKGWPALFRNQQEHAYRRFMPREVAGMTVGIIGMGAIGAEVARLARPFGCRILGMRRSFTARGPDSLADEAVPPSDLDYLLRESDVVVLTAPFTEETRGLIGPKALATMKPDALLVNVARGSLVDEPALIAALQAGQIGGAALDVFAEEPLPTDSPLWDLDRVILTPHIAGGTDRYFERATAIFCENFERYLAGKPLLNVVDPRRGY